MLDQVVEATPYVRADPVVLSMLVVTGCFSLFAMNRLTLVPLFAEQVLHTGPAGRDGHRRRRHGGRPGGCPAARPGGAHARAG
jgi:hypothetical protein